MIFSAQEEMTLGSTTFIAHDLGGHRQGNVQLRLVAPAFKSETTFLLTGSACALESVFAWFYSCL